MEGLTREPDRQCTIRDASAGKTGDDHHSRGHPPGHEISWHRPSGGPLSSAEDWLWHCSKRSISSSLQPVRAYGIHVSKVGHCVVQNQLSMASIWIQVRKPNLCLFIFTESPQSLFCAKRDAQRPLTVFRSGIRILPFLLFLGSAAPFPTGSLLPFPCAPLPPSQHSSP